MNFKIAFLITLLTFIFKSTINIAHTQVLVFRETTALNTTAYSDSAHLHNNNNLPQVTVDNSGNWLAVWSSYENLDGRIGTDSDIFISRSIDNGAAWSDPLTLNKNAAFDFENDTAPQVTTDNSGNWIAVWLSGFSTILVSHSTDNGLNWSAPSTLSTIASDVENDGSPQIATDGSGNWIAVWEYYGGGDSDVFASRSNNNGVSWSTPSLIDSNAAFQSGLDENPQIATDKSGIWIAVWQSSWGLAIDDFDISISRSTDNGITWSDPVGLNTNTNFDDIHHDDDKYPQIMTDNSGNWVAVWQSITNLGGTIGVDADIFVSRSNDSGITWSDPTILNSNADSDTQADAYPQITADNFGNWIAVWNSAENLGSVIGGDDDILFSHSANNGATWSVPSALNKNASSDSGLDVYPQVTTDNSGNWVAVWPSNDSLSGMVGEDYDIFVATGSFQAEPLIINPSNRNHGSGVETGSITVTSEISWTVSNSESWMTVDSSNSGNGNGTIHYSTSNNSSTSSRSGAITISGGGFAKIFTVYQEGRGRYGEFVIQQYRDFLSRDPDSGGLHFYKERLENGEFTMALTVSNFISSPEFADNNGFVARCYFTIYNDNYRTDYSHSSYRYPDYDGQNFQVNSMNNIMASGGSLLDAQMTVINGFTASPEWNARVGNKNNSEFVTFLYENILGRQQDVVGYSSHLNNLNAGSVTRQQLIHQFIISPEAVNKYRYHTYTVMAYLGLLDRVTDREGFVFHVDRLHQGLVDEVEFLNGFIESPEYYNRLTSLGVYHPGLARPAVRKGNEFELSQSVEDIKAVRVNVTVENETEIRCIKLPISTKETVTANFRYYWVDDAGNKRMYGSTGNFEIQSGIRTLTSPILKWYLEPGFDYQIELIWIGSMDVVGGEEALLESMLFLTEK